MIKINRIGIADDLARATEFGIEVLPVATFLRRLWAGEIRAK